MLRERRQAAALQSGLWGGFGFGGAPLGDELIEFRADFGFEFSLCVGGEFVEFEGALGLVGGIAWEVCGGEGFGGFGAESGVVWIECGRVIGCVGEVFLDSF